VIAVISKGGGNVHVFRPKPFEFKTNDFPVNQNLIAWCCFLQYRVAKKYLTTAYLSQD
jgi:hypothetical protein